MIQKLLLLAMAGALGTLARYGLARAVQRMIGMELVWGTLAVNVIGCFAFGLIMALASGRASITPEARIIILVGFMGAFTTFSTFIFETNQLLDQARWLHAAGSVILHNTVGILVLFAGLALGRSI
ncbi:hypothetical protein LCGC14_2481510 [marine sediment metagenome]|uniref:Fluoride ion transporter CrcB n=1 Tax=marine sediment metagenome TaxID=412755 RepID=A0A0F9B8A7_9ZZZZ